MKNIFTDCSCGSKLDFVECCFKSKSGKTEEYTKIKILEAVVNTFYNFGEKRGELCLYSSKLVQDVLKKFHDTNSFLIMGSASWNNYPEHFEWKVESNQINSFHAWILTEYGEIVDLTCDNLDERSDAKNSRATELGIKPPGRCWEKIQTIDDRIYTGKIIGVDDIGFDYEEYSKPLNVCFNLYSRSISEKLIF